MSYQQIKNLKNFIKQFEIVFHTDWQYTSELLGQDLYLDEQTFIKGEWVSNWCNKDSLLEWFLKLEKEYSPENLKQFSYYFEAVFDTDWEYTKAFLGIEDETEKSKELDIETIHIISPNGTFINPKLTADELAMANWKNRDLLLKYYRDLKKKF